MASSFTMIHANAGGGAEIECQLTFGGDTETQFWDYYPQQNNVWSESTRMATYWPHDQHRPEIKNPNNDFFGRWNISESFDIVLYNITSSMTGYFRCGQSLSNGSSYYDQFIFLNSTSHRSASSAETQDIQSGPNLEIILPVAFAIFFLLLIIIVFSCFWQNIKSSWRILRKKETKNNVPRWRDVRNKLREVDKSSRSEGLPLRRAMLNVIHDVLKGLDVEDGSKFCEPRAQELQPKSERPEAFATYIEDIYTQIQAISKPLSKTLLSVLVGANALLLDQESSVIDTEAILQNDDVPAIGRWTACSSFMNLLVTEFRNIERADDLKERIAAYLYDRDILCRSEITNVKSTNQRQIQPLTSSSGSIREDSKGFDKDILRALVVAQCIRVKTQKERELLHLRILADVVYMEAPPLKPNTKNLKVSVPDTITEESTENETTQIL